MHQHRLCIWKLMQIIWRGSKLWQLSACSVIIFLKCLLQAENSKTGRAYMGEVLIQVWGVIRQTSECTKREFEKYFQGSRELPQAHEKVCDENESRNKQK